MDYQVPQEGAVRTGSGAAERPHTGDMQNQRVDIIKGSISKDHVHLFLSVPPFLSVSKLMQSLKGKTSYKLLSEFKELSKQPSGAATYGAGGTLWHHRAT